MAGGCVLGELLRATREKMQDGVVQIRYRTAFVHMMMRWVLW